MSLFNLTPIVFHPKTADLENYSDKHVRFQFQNSITALNSINYPSTEN